MILLCGGEIIDSSFHELQLLLENGVCVPGTSTPSERVFSHCGVELTAKRETMHGDAPMNQVLLKNNLKHVNSSMEDI
jgi:hypothetical protein